MKPRRTPKSNKVYRLVGGNEDNDLWSEVTEQDGLPLLLTFVEIVEEDELPVVNSVWELTDEERAAVADGANIELTVWGLGMPPVAMRTTTVELGKGST